MRKHIIVVMILALIFCAGLSVATVYAEEDTSLNDYEYTETADGITITKYTGSGTEVTVPAEINGKPVKVIGDNVFHTQYELRSINLPETIETIGNNAFRHCNSLESFSFPSALKTIGNGAFMTCNKLKEVELPSGVESIGESAFCECYAMTKISMPNTIETIADNTFKNCPNLVSFNFPSALKTIGNGAFQSCERIKEVELPSGVESIGESAFSKCYAMTKFSMPDTIETIADSTFENCQNLEFINFPSALKTIGKKAFLSCGKIKEVELPNGVESIGESAFSKCYAMTKFSMPDTIETIADSAFENCPNLEFINFPSALKTIGKRAFLSCGKIKEVELPNGVESIGESAFYDCFALAKFSMPDTITEIPDYAFYNCGILSDFRLPDSCRSIGGRAFYKCFKLPELTFPDKLETIGDEAFEFTKLKHIILPDSVTEIGAKCFAVCSDLEDLKMSMNLKKIGDSAFQQCYELKEVVFGPAVETVGKDAFEDTRGLKDVYICDLEHYDSEIEFGEGDANPTNRAGVRTHAVNHLSKVIFEDCNFTYDGTEHTVVPECKTLSAEDYVYDELKVKDPGTYELVVKYANPKKCYGEKTLKITVSKRHLEKSDVSISGMKNLTYTGKALKQNLIVTLGEQELVAGTDYRVYYDDNTSVGTALMNIDFKGNYTGSIDDLTFEILPENASEFKATLSSDSYTYTGEEKKPAVTVRNSEGRLVDDSEYDVTYSNNRDAGTATAKVVFKGNYTGSKTLEFEILPADASDFKAALSSDSYTYTGEEKKPAVTVYDAEDNIIDQSSYEVTYSNNKDAGTAAAKVAFKDNYTGSKTLEFKILPAKANCTLSAKAFVYTGKEKKPAVTVCDEEGNAVDSTEYTVTYSKNKAVGTASANIAFKGNYCSDVETLNFTIKPAKASIYRLTPGTKKLTVKMSTKPSAKGATRYQLAYKQKGTSTWKYTTTSTQTKTIKNLKKGKRYYVKARAYKTVNSKKYYGSWSKIKLSRTIK